jgi:hypothetical protein
MRAAAGLGFRVKTGRAVAVWLVGPPEAPRVLARREISLCDPELPESRQPHHAALDLPAGEGEQAVRRATAAARRVTLRAVRDLAGELRAAGCRIAGVGIVTGSDADPARIANPHVRAHAAEGRLFRELVEEGARACGLRARTWLERDAWSRAAEALGRPEDELRRAAAELGRSVGRPWRGEEKLAALAAWSALVR